MKRRPGRPTTIPKQKPPQVRRAPLAKQPRRRSLPPRFEAPPPLRTMRRPSPPKREVARIVDEGEKSLVDVLDNLLNQGVVLNADLILALADVDLIYIRLSALLCAADRVMPTRR